MAEEGTGIAYLLDFGKAGQFRKVSLTALDHDTVPSRTPSDLCR